MLQIAQWIQLNFHGGTIYMVIFKVIDIRYLNETRPLEEKGPRCQSRADDIRSRDHAVVQL